MASKGRLAGNARVIILPEKGCDDIDDANWYAWMAKQLRETGLFSDVIARTMPDPYVAREVRMSFVEFMLVLGAGQSNLMT
jgi:hypothetical protein